MVTNENKVLFVRLVDSGQNTIEQLNKYGFDTGTVKYLCSPAHDDQIAFIEGDYIRLNRVGADLLYELKQQDKEEQHKKKQLCITAIAAVGSILSAILLGIQVVLYLLRL